MGLEFGDWSVSNFKCIASGSLITDFDVKATVGVAKDFQNEVTIFKVTKPFYIQAGLVPITGAIEMRFIGGVAGGGALQGTAGAGYDSAHTVKLGAEYDGSSWTTYSDRSSSFEEHPPYIEVEGSANIQAYVRPELEINLYDSFLQTINIKPYAQLDASGTLVPAIDITWALKGGITSSVTASLAILGLDIASIDQEVLNWETEIATGRIVAPAITSVSPTGGLSGRQFTFEPEIGEAGADTWSWDFGGACTPNTSSQMSPLVTFNGPGTYDCSVTATNAVGSDTYDFSLTVYDSSKLIWPMLGCDAQRTWRSPFVGSSVLNEKWMAGGAGAAVIGPDNTIYAAYKDTINDRIAVRALDPADGAEVWTYPSPGTGFIEEDWLCPAVWVDGTLYLAWGFLYLVDPGGGLLFSSDTGGLASESPVIGVDGTIYSSQDTYQYAGTFYAFNRDGDYHWNFEDVSPSDAHHAQLETGGRFSGPSAVGPNGTIYALKDYQRPGWPRNLNLIAISRAGKQLWATPLPGQGRWVSIADDGTVYVKSSGVVAYNEYLTAFGSGGARKWTIDFGPAYFTVSNTAIGPDGTIYTGGGTELHAITSGGSIKWTSELPHGTSSVTVDADGKIYVAALNNSCLLNPNGSLIKEIDSALYGGHFGFFMIGSDGTVYGSTDQLVAYGD